MFFDVENSGTCSICYEENVFGVMTACRHFFHKECLLKWLKVKANCPYCRTEIKKLETLLTNKKYKNIEIMEETPYYFYVKLLDRFAGIPIQFLTIDKSDIDLITSHVNGFEISTIQAIYIFIKNDMDIVDTIMEFVGYSD